MKPYAKHPLDLAKELDLGSLTASEERVFWRTFELARHHEPLTGYLVDREYRSLTALAIARLSGVPASTVKSALVVLRARLVMPALAGEYLPIVQAIASRYTRRTTTNVDANQMALIDVDNRAGPISTGQKKLGISEDPGPPHYLGSLDPDRRTSVDVDKRDPEPLIAVPDLSIDLAPSEIQSETARYLLGKLAAADERWAAACRRPRDVANLVTLATDQPGAFLAALQQQVDAPNARNPLGWLNRTVRSIAEPQEVGA